MVSNNTYLININNASMLIHYNFFLKSVQILRSPFIDTIKRESLLIVHITFEVVFGVAKSMYMGGSF